MKSNTVRILFAVAVAAVAIVLFVVLRDDGESAMEKSEKDAGQARSPVTTIVVKHGKPVGGIAQLTYNEGERVRFKVDSDVSEEIHVHGYDIMKDVEPGGSVSFDFPATIEGVFEAELEGRGEQILELTVNP